MVVRVTKRDPHSLRKFGPRFEIELGPPIVRAPLGIMMPKPLPGAPPGRFSRVPALIDTGAGKTVVTPAAVQRVGLQKIHETKLARAGGVTENAGVYAASMQFTAHRLATIELIEVICCELPVSLFSACWVEMFLPGGFSLITGLWTSGALMRRKSQLGWNLLKALISRRPGLRSASASQYTGTCNPRSRRGGAGRRIGDLSIRGERRLSQPLSGNPKCTGR